MATQLNSSNALLGGRPSADVAAAMRRVSLPHVPLMVVVTDVDEENPENSSNPVEEFTRMSKSILRSDNSDNSFAMYGAGVGGAGGGRRRSPSPSGKRGGATLDPGVAKPLTKWKRICKCFIGLKGSKHKSLKDKQHSETSSGQSSSTDDKIESSLEPRLSRSPSASLYPGGRLSVSSVSPSRSIQSIRSRLSAKSEADFYLCDMGNISEVLTINDIKALSQHFPPSAVGCPCILTFSTTVDGYSLHSLYRKMENIDSPVILAILDSEGRAFGALLSCALKVSEHFYGSGESFLFRCDPKLEIYKWQEGANYFFIHSEDTFLRIGAGKGNSGLWLDDNLYHGRTEECATFGSQPLVPEEDFEVQTVECWTFGHSI